MRSAAACATACCTDWSLEKTLRYANAAGAIVAVPAGVLDRDADRRGGGRARRTDRSGGRQCLIQASGHSAPTTPRSPTCAPHDPGAIARAWQHRTTRPTIRGDGRLMIVAADHPARGALAVGTRPTAMNSRTDLLDRLRAALADPGVDGVLATSDILDDLAVARRARGQGRVLVVQPRRTGRRLVRTRRPDDRRHRRVHRRGEDERRKDAVPHRSRRCGHRRDHGRVRAGRRRAGRPRSDRDARAVHVQPRRRQGPQRPVAPTRSSSRCTSARASARRRPTPG